MSFPQPIRPRRLAANRANAQLSTGPRTEEGKAKSSLNAVKTGLTGRTVLLPSEDVAAYRSHIERFRREFQPVGDFETHLVQNLADTQWRLDRIPNLETGLFALGRMRYADLFEDEQNPQVRRAMLDAPHPHDGSQALQEPSPAGKPLTPPIPTRPARTAETARGTQAEGGTNPNSKKARRPGSVSQWL